MDQHVIGRSVYESTSFKRQTRAIRRPGVEHSTPARAKFGRARFHRGSACSRCQPRTSGATPGGPSDRCPDGGPLPLDERAASVGVEHGGSDKGPETGTSPQSLIAPVDHRPTIPDHPGSSPASRASRPQAGTSTASRKAAANADRKATSPPRPDRAKRAPPPPPRPRRGPDRRLAPSLVTARASPAARSPKPARQRHGTRARGNLGRPSLGSDTRRPTPNRSRPASGTAKRPRTQSLSATRTAAPSSATSPAQTTPASRPPRPLSRPSR